MVAIADDLTGAADCAAACAAHGMSATVVLHSSGDDAAHWPDTQIVSIDADTRCTSAERAAQTTAELVRFAHARAPAAILFKKVDSTLRGNMAAELAAALSTSRGASGKKELAILLAPALPAQGRTTLGGRQMVHGRPLEDTDLWRREARAPRSSISEVLAEAGLSCGLVDIATVRAGGRRLAETVTELAKEADVIVGDAETEDDLRLIAEAATVGKGAFLWAGSAGLAAQLPHATGMHRSGSGGAQVVFAPGPTLFVVGSAASISQEQVDVLAAESDVVTVRISPDALLSAEPETVRMIEALQRGRDTVVVLDGAAQCSGSDAQLLSKALSRLVKPCADLFGGLVATGGETARAVLDGLAIDRLQLLGEVEPGLPFSIADRWTRPLPVLTKAGGFGSPETLVRCREFVRKLQRVAKAEPQRKFVGREN